MELILSFHQILLYAQLSYKLLEIWSFSLTLDVAIKNLLEQKSYINKIELYCVEEPDDYIFIPFYVALDVAINTKSFRYGQINPKEFMKKRMHGRGLQYFLEMPRNKW
jgi:hypothetical protein